MDAPSQVIREPNGTLRAIYDRGAVRSPKPGDGETVLVRLGDFMDAKDHKQRHVELHRALDELFADFITHGGGRTTNTILDLIEWSCKQTISPDHEE